MQDQVMNMKDAANASLQKQGTNIATTTTLQRVKGLLSNDAVKQKFQEVLKDKAASFIASITSLVTSTQNFEGVDPNTIMQSAMIAATLDLPINSNLGFAYIVPYSGRATFQLGWKGLVQLALRTGQYRLLNAVEVYEGELISRNKITGEIILDQTKRTSEVVIGYVSFFRLINGFEKTLFMSADEMEKHAKKYSQTYKSTKKWVVEQSKWTTDFNSMALKTVLKLILSRFGILSVELQKAIQADQAVISETKDGEIQYEYVDNTEEVETETIVTTIEEKPFNPEELMTASYWLKQIQDCPNAEWSKFKKEHKNDFDMFTGDDLETVKRAELEKDSVVRTANKKS
jgi:recombination protein RecT